MPSSAAASPEASTTALAPSFSGEELPAVIWVVLGCGGSAARLLRGRVAADRSRRARTCGPACLRVPGISTGWISFASRPGVPRRGGVLVGAQRERVDLLAA